jgi:four helix bundle protein
MQDYHRLPIWKRAHDIALAIDALSRRIPRGRHAGLVGQLQRASLSIPANIAEGASRGSDKDFANFLQIAAASTTEVEYHLEFAAAARIISRAEFEIRRAELEELRKMTMGFARYLRNQSRVSPSPGAPR